MGIQDSERGRELAFAMSLICCTVKTVFEVCSANLVSSRMNFLAYKEHTSYIKTHRCVIQKIFKGGKIGFINFFRGSSIAH